MNDTRTEGRPTLRGRERILRQSLRAFYIYFALFIVCWSIFGAVCICKGFALLASIYDVPTPKGGVLAAIILYATVIAIHLFGIFAFLKENFHLIKVYAAFYFFLAGPCLFAAGTAQVYTLGLNSVECSYYDQGCSSRYNSSLKGYYFAFAVDFVLFVDQFVAALYLNAEVFGIVNASHSQNQFPPTKVPRPSGQETPPPYLLANASSSQDQIPLTNQTELSNLPQYALPAYDQQRPRDMKDGLESAKMWGGDEDSV